MSPNQILNARQPLPTLAPKQTTALDAIKHWLDTKTTPATKPSKLKDLFKHYQAYCADHAFTPVTLPELAIILRCAGVKCLVNTSGTQFYIKSAQ